MNVGRTASGSTSRDWQQANGRETISPGTREQGGTAGNHRRGTRCTWELIKFGMSWWLLTMTAHPECRAPSQVNLSTTPIIRPSYKTPSFYFSSIIPLCKQMCLCALVFNPETMASCYFPSLKTFCRTPARALSAAVHWPLGSCSSKSGAPLLSEEGLQLPLSQGLQIAK